ncbi:hypothetical protein [Trinickia mobilis]|uniref:hypothetical protein n=1 Tax=Trinickia mobilis TaxID=2816356 RepID=UPI001A8E9482|nr:hypothetical protein [Trinickia mobilis]
MCSGTVPVYSETITIPEAGQPGLVFVGMYNPAKTQADYLAQSGAWGTYQGGLYPPYGRYDAGLPGSVQVLVPLPGNDGTTNAVLGWTMYVGYGVLTPDAQAQVQARRSALNSMRAQRIAAGTWNAAYDSDDQFKWSLVQKDLTDNGKYHLSLVIPPLNCNPPDTGGGG